MPRSSRHKSSKHSSRDARECSDSERDSGGKDRRKGKDASVASKDTRDSSLREKRRHDSRSGTGNEEHSDEYSSSKRRRERGGGDERREAAKKAATSDSKSRRRRDESDREGRKESREGRRRGRSVDNEEFKVHDYTDLRKVDEMQSPELDDQLERPMRKKRDSGDDDKHQDDVGDGYNRCLSSRDDIRKDGRQKHGKRKDEKYRDKYREEMDRENKHRHDKQQDEHYAKDHSSIKFDDKHAREENDGLEFRQKITKLPKSDHDRDRYHNHDRDCNFESGRAHEQHYERVHDLERDRDCHRDRDWDRDNDHDQDRDCDCDHDYRSHHDRDCNGSHVGDQIARSKDSGTKKKTMYSHDDYTDTKFRVVKGQYTDGEKKSFSSSRVDSDVDRGRSQPRQAHVDSTGTSNKPRSSPASNTIVKDEYRNANFEDPIYRDSMIEQRTKDSREEYSGIPERGPKYKSMEKPFKIDDGPLGDLSTEWSSGANASPMGLMERSPSTSIECRYMNKIKSGVRQSLEIEESDRRNSIEGRDFSASDDRLGWELPREKPLLDEHPRVESSFYDRASQGNASLIPPPSAFRAALDRPFMGSLEDDVRDNSNSQHRSSDPSFGRGHGNSWRAVPNWTSPVPNGFVSFHPGPAHGGFPTMMPHFTSQPLFGVRPSMEFNHAGIPYHITDADRFPGHLRPLGWQYMMDGAGPPNSHGWESNNGVFRDDPHMYGGSDWDQNRHSTNSRGWKSGSETWKEHRGHSKDLPSPAGKDESVPVQVDDDLIDQTVQASRDGEHNLDKFHENSPESSHLNSLSILPLNSLSSTALEKVPDSLTPSYNSALFSRFYLSKLDISADLLIPELYDQCMCLVNVDKNASIDADSSAKLFHKNVSRAQKIFIATFSRHSPLPAIDNSIFQRAIDIYKKQKLELPSEGKIDIISAFNQVQVGESIPVPSLGSRHVSASASNGTEDLPISTLGDKKLESLSPAKEHLEEIDQTCGQKGLEKQIEPVAGLWEKEGEVTSNKVNPGDAEENKPMAFKNESQSGPALHDDGDNMNSKAKTTGFAHHADEKQGFVDTMVSPLIFEDGSPRACDALMPGSNESESLILSQIHHSPESTH